MLPGRKNISPRVGKGRFNVWLRHCVFRIIIAICLETRRYKTLFIGARETNNIKSLRNPAGPGRFCGFRYRRFAENSTRAVPHFGLRATGIYCYYYFVIDDNITRAHALNC